MTRVPFDVSITDDEVLEGDEDFTLTIDPSGDYNVRNRKDSTTVTIKNDDCKFVFIPYCLHMHVY